jgi:Rod binding domain-containing protein
LSPATGGGNGKPRNAKEAATQFEGMLIGEMLRSAHDSNSGNLDGDEDSDSESDTTYSMAADQFAQILAKQGGFGVAKLLTPRLASSEKNAPDSGSPNAIAPSPIRKAGVPDSDHKPNAGSAETVAKPL